MPPSVPAPTDISSTSWKRCESHAPTEQSSIVHIWLDGIENPLPSPTKRRLTRSRIPLQSRQARLTPSPRCIPLESVSTQKRKRPIDEDNSNNHGLEPRRSVRIKQTEDQSHSRPQPNLQTRRRGRSLKHASTTTGRPKTGSLDDPEGDGLADKEAVLPLRNDRAILGNTEVPSFPPPLPSPTRTGTTRTSSRSSPSRVKGIKRECLANLIPAITFETIREGKKHWPLHVQKLWTDRISSLVHETKVVPPQLKVSATSGSYRILLNYCRVE